MSADFDWGRFTPVVGSDYSVFKSAYKNIRFGVRVSQYITLSSADAANLPGLSFRLFNDTSLWRVLLAFNGLEDPLSDVYAGQKLAIPAKSDVIAYLSSQQKNQPVVLTI